MVMDSYLWMSCASTSWYVIDHAWLNVISTAIIIVIIFTTATTIFFFRTSVYRNGVCICDMYWLTSNIISPHGLISLGYFSFCMVQCWFTVAILLGLWVRREEVLNFLLFVIMTIVPAVIIILLSPEVDVFPFSYTRCYPKNTYAHMCVCVYNCYVKARLKYTHRWMDV